MRRVTALACCLFLFGLSACAGGGGEGTAAPEVETEGDSVPSPTGTAPEETEPEGPRLEGVFVIKAKTVGASGAAAGNLGIKFRRTWTFIPNCRAGPCEFTLKQETAGSTSTGELTLEGQRFSGRFAGFLECFNTDTGELIDARGYKTIFIHDGRITASEERRGELVATKIAGKWDAIGKPANPKCKGRGEQNIRYTGVLKK